MVYPSKSTRTGHFCTRKLISESGASFCKQILSCKSIVCPSKPTRMNISGHAKSSVNPCASFHRKHYFHLYYIVYIVYNNIINTYIYIYLFIYYIYTYTYIYLFLYAYIYMFVYIYFLIHTKSQVEHWDQVANATKNRPSTLRFRHPQ